MTFWARGSGRDNGLSEDAAAIRGLGLPVGQPPVPPATAATPETIPTLPAWAENAVKRLLATVMPHLQPLIARTETVLSDAQTTLAGVRSDQIATRDQLAELTLAVKQLAAAIERPPGAPLQPMPQVPVQPVPQPEQPVPQPEPPEPQPGRRRDRS